MAPNENLMSDNIVERLIYEHEQQQTAVRNMPAVPFVQIYYNEFQQPILPGPVDMGVPPI